MQKNYQSIAEAHLKLHGYSEKKLAEVLGSFDFCQPTCDAAAVTGQSSTPHNRIGKMGGVKLPPSNGLPGVLRPSFESVARSGDRPQPVFG
jgi:hypothetical protein